MDTKNFNDQSSSSGKSLPKGSSMTKPLAVIVLLIIFTAVGFWGGIKYEKGHVKSNLAANSTSSNVTSGNRGYSSGGYGRYSGQRPIFGSVTAISPTSISVQDSQTTATVTMAITSSTIITNNGQSATTSAIQTGDTVAVIASSSDSSQASRILVNPSYGGGSSTPPPTNGSTD